MAIVYGAKAVDPDEALRQMEARNTMEIIAALRESLSLLREARECLTEWCDSHRCCCRINEKIDPKLEAFLARFPC